MCDKVATSVEHVPPRCLFPESKDFPGENFRVNLITVPSCDEHNSLKSKDDEFLMVSIAGTIGNNSIGYKYKLTKVNRAILHTSGNLLNLALRNQKIEHIKLSENKFIEVIFGTPDFDRLEICFKHIAYGMYFHHFKQRFNGEMRILFGHFACKEKDGNTFTQFIKDKLELELKDKPKLGTNQRIFSYQFTDPDQFGVFSLILEFYQGVEVIFALQPNNTSVPPDFTLLLMQNGIKTYIRQGDKTYEFN
jgi:hypothetical protein